MKVKQPFAVIKQEAIKTYNSINREIFDIGVRSQRLEILGDKLLIFANHKRNPVLKLLDDKERMLTLLVDHTLTEESKRPLKREMERITGVPVKVVLRDYDPITEYAATIIIFEENLEE